MKSIVVNGRSRKFQVARGVAGVVLILASLPVSFVNAVSAGFFFVVGAFACMSVVLDWQRLKSLNLSLTSIGAELFEKIEEKVQDAETILAQVRDVEARISFVITEQMLNRGGNKYIGGYGEEAEFEIYKSLLQLNTNKYVSVTKNMQELKQRLCYGFCNAIFGYQWRLEGPIKHWFDATDYKVLPDRDKIVELAALGGVNISTAREVIEAYIAFKDEDVFPQHSLIVRLYDFKRVGAPF